MSMCPAFCFVSLGFADGLGGGEDGGEEMDWADRMGGW